MEVAIFVLLAVVLAVQGVTLYQLHTARRQAGDTAMLELALLASEQRQL